MTKIILNFPARRSVPLCCVWMATGNPAQPLVCMWMADRQLADHQSPDVEEPRARLLCA